MIIGLTGLNCAGKGTVAEILQKKGFKYTSLSDAIREEMRKRGTEITRDNLIATGKDLRSKQGDSVLAEMTKLKIPWKHDFIVDSIRHPAEIESLMMRKDFFFVCVDAPSKLRFERMKSRKRESDATTYAEMLEQEKKELQTEGSGQQLGVCISKAQIKINNDCSKAQLKKKVERMLADLRKREAKIYEDIHKSRPSWDEYFMNLVSEVGKRGTCDRGRSGCVIVKDKRIMTTGYVGSPVGIAHCDEIGHQMKKTVHEDGTISQHCVRTAHAEQNAICQAARYGIKIDGATLYCHMEPCYVCAKLVINAGIKRVVCKKRYHGARDSIELFKQAGVKLEVLQDEMETYKNM